jgi:hypothetical protein
MWNLSHDDLCDAQGDADYALRAARLDHEEVPSMSLLVARTVGSRPRAWRGLRQRAKLSRLLDDWIVYHRSDLPAPLLRFCLAHEVGEFVYKDRGFGADEIEARSNAFAAACCAPRDSVKRAAWRHGHAVYRLATELAVPQSVVALRLGEVLDRPVVLVRGDLPIVRGAPFGWPPANELLRLVKAPPLEVHPLKIADSPGRWALLARRAA